MTSIDPHFGAAKLVRNQAIEKGAADCAAPIITHFG